MQTLIDGAINSFNGELSFTFLFSTFAKYCDLNGSKITSIGSNYQQVQLIRGLIKLE